MGLGLEEGPACPPLVRFRVPTPQAPAEIGPETHALTPQPTTPVSSEQHPPPSPASQTAAAAPAPTRPPPSQAPFCTISGQGGGDRRRKEGGEGRLLKCQRSGCHRRPPPRTAPLPRALGGRRHPRRPQPARPQPARRPTPSLHALGTCSPATVPTATPHTQFSRDRLLRRESPARAARSTAGDSLDPSTPAPRRVGEGAS